MFDPTKLGAFYRYQWTHVHVTVSSVQQILQYNPYRVAFIISNNGAVCTIGPSNIVAASSGIGIPSGGNFTLFSLATIGPIVQTDWWIFCGTVPDDITLAEVLWVPPGD